MYVHKPFHDYVNPMSLHRVPPISISISIKRHRFGLDHIMYAVCMMFVEWTQLNRNSLHSRPSGLPTHRITRSNCTPLTDPPAIAVRTLRLKASRFVRRSSAASLFRGSEAFGSRKRNYPANPRSARQLHPTGSNSRKPTCMPTITAFKFKTGFQSSLRIFKQTFPSRSIFG